MIEDIEARIAEIFQSKPSWKTGVISKEDVEEIMATMGGLKRLPVNWKLKQERKRKQDQGALQGY